MTIADQPSPQPAAPILGGMTFEIAIHEAGHAAVAHALGFRVIAVRQDHDGIFSCVIEQSEEPDDLEHWSLAIVALAGGAAERRLLGIAIPGDATDRQAAARHVLAWLGDRSKGREHEYAQLIRAAGVALTLVDGSEGVIRSLANKLLECEGVLDETQLGEVLR